jgi:Zn-dependent peptidase ImmA (M78 family)
VTTNEARARHLATRFRTDHGLDDQPLGDLFELVHAALGIDVIAMDADDSEHGLSAMDPATGRVVIAVATTGHPMRQRSSIAHELGHVLGGDLERPDSFRPGERTGPEVRADAFARHLLLPATVVTSRVGGTAGDVSERALSELVQEFGASPALAAIQLREAGLLAEHRCRDWCRLTTRTIAARHGWLDQYRSMARAASQARAPQALMSRAVAGYLAGVLGIVELAHWYNQSEVDLRAALAFPDPDDDWITPSTTPYDTDEDWADDTPLFPPDPDARS